MAGPYINSYIFGQLILDKGSKAIQWEKKDAMTTLQQMILGQLSTHVQTTGAEPQHHTIYKN